MRKLILDVGNTRTKFAVFDGDVLAESGFLKGSAAERPDHIARMYGPFYSTMLASVTSGEIVTGSELFGNVVRMRSGMKLPVKITYKTPETLGSDRLANVVGAWKINPERTTLVIDAGTCIKYDLLIAGTEYPGGIISPGIAMRFKSMNRYTDKLPSLKPEPEIPPLVGQSTEGSMRSGVVNGARAEARGLFEQFNTLYKELDIILTGGDAGLFEGMVKSAIFVAPTLTLTGLKVILDHND
ncbi:MAG TPA: type III pantothenate kinase [Bacteroidia bacterium]|nr:type III pantothenate kinase [Bacteroidia bacterium]